MSFLDAALDAYRAPNSDDLDIELPARREPKKEAEAAGEPSDLGQHGGAAGAAPASSDGVAGNVSEPELQRDEPDDGEHTDSTEQEVEARAQQAAEQAGETEDEPDVADTTLELEESVEETVEPEPEPVPVEAELPAMSVTQKLAAIEGSAPRMFQKIGFSSGGVETVVIKPFPKPLVDRLRLTLASSVGGEFAEALSSVSLMTAFLMAKTGVELDVDANTAVAVDVFRQVDPRLLSVEDKIDEMRSNVSQLADAMKLSLNRIAETGSVADVLEFAMAYLIADRVAGLTTSDTDETNVDVTQKKVLVARETIRIRSKAHRKIEQQRDGRRLK